MSYESLYVGGVVGLVSGGVWWLLGLVREARGESKKESYIDKNGYVKKADLRELELVIIGRLNEISAKLSGDIHHAKDIARQAVTKMGEIEEEIERMRQREGD